MHSADFLARHANQLLTGGFERMSGPEVATALDDMMTVFRYISDKDIFEDFYKNHLAHRLLQGKSQDDANERAVISKLKAECGHQFTSKMEGMFKDISASRSLQHKWQQFQQKKKVPGDGLELATNILTTGFWPLGKANQCTLPPRVVKKCEEFKKFYQQEHNGRKLRFLSEKGTAEVAVDFEAGTKQLIVSTYQMCIINLFNSKQTLTYKDICERTQMKEGLSSHILSLAHPKVKVLLKKPNNKKLEDDHLFRINWKFKSPKYRIRVPLQRSLGSPDKSLNSGKDGIPATVVEARKNWVEAAVVRIMKSRKYLKHSELMKETIHQLSSRFAPEQLFIKKRIASLIEREYLERDSKDRTLYHYLA